MFTMKDSTKIVAIFSLTSTLLFSGIALAAPSTPAPAVKPAVHATTPPPPPVAAPPLTPQEQIQALAQEVQYVQSQRDAAEQVVFQLRGELSQCLAGHPEAVTKK